MQNSSKSNSSDVYISSAWRQHADLITHLCHFSQNILLVLGQKGAGKTTFFENFIIMPSAGLKICAVKADKDKTVEALLKEVATGFELNWESTQNTTLQVQTQAIASYQKAHETWMLMIDDAHLLDDMQLAALLQLVQFNDEARQQLHLVLMGESSLETRLFSPGLALWAQGKVYSIELEPWTLHDLKRYFSRKDSTMPLDPEQIANIFAKTEGLPGRVVNEQYSLQDPFTKGANTMIKQNAKRWTHPIALGAVAGFLLGGGYLLFNSTQEEETINAPVNAAQVENYRLDNSDEKIAMDEEPAPVVSMQESSSLVTSKPTAEMSANAQIQANPPTPALPQIEAKPETMAAAALPAKPETTTVAALPVKPETTTLNTQAKAETITTTQATTQEKTQITPVEAVKPSKSSKALSKEEEHLLTVDKHHYTLQLVGARNEQSLQKFIQKNELEEHAYIYRTKLSGKDWYVVILGEYPTMDEAKAAASVIPSHIAAKPWVREFVSVHSDIKKQG